MAVDIFQMLVDIFKISPSMVSKYASVTPLEQMFYLFFFPTLFIIILIYIMVSHWMSEHKGLSIMLAIAVYAFIIFQGFYSWFVFLSPYWLIMLLVLGGIWLFFRPKSGGASGMTAGKGKRLLGNFKTALIGDRSWNPLEIAADRKMYEQKIKELSAEIEKAEEEKRNTPKEQQGIISDSIARMKADKRELEHRRKEHLRMVKSS